jgi:DNA-binding CsgD family transcriptional regulator
MCAFGADLRLVEWNDGAERLTGIRAQDAIGCPCWAVLAGRADDGSLICHKDCSGARLAREGWPLRPQTLDIRTARGRCRVAVDTITVDGGLTVHLLKPKPGAPHLFRPKESAVTLTERQLEVLRLLGEGIRARGIAGRLGLAEATVRNHIHAVLQELEAHSQLEAVYQARAGGLI